MNRAVFLDRDGVINEVVKREDGRLTSPHRLEELVYMPDVLEVTTKLRNYGYKLFVITNQPGVFYGDMSIFELVRICNAMKSWLRLDEIYPCIFPTHQGSEDDYKPGCGAFRKLIKKYNINVTKSYMIGDRIKDIIPGQKVGLTTIFYKYLDEPSGNPDYIVDKLIDILDIIK